VASYAYDALGRRIERVDEKASTTLRFYYTDQRVIEDTDASGGGAVQRHYIWGNYIDELLLMRDVAGIGGTANEDLVVLRDERFSPTALVKRSDGSIVERYEHDAFGKTNFLNADFTTKGTQQSSYGLRYAYTGRELDILDTGGFAIMYFRGRYYDPATGTFYQRDPAGYPDGMNAYAGYFAMWDDVDPLGLGKLQAVKKLVTVASKAFARLERHHVLTKQVFKTHGSKLEKLGFKVNDADNLVPALQKGFNREHRAYSEYVEKSVQETLDKLRNRTLSPSQAADELKALQNRLRTEIENGTRKLVHDSDIPPGAAVAAAVAVPAAMADAAPPAATDPCGGSAAAAGELADVLGQMEQDLRAGAADDDQSNLLKDAVDIMVGVTPVGDVQSIVRDAPQAANALSAIHDSMTQAAEQTTKIGQQNITDLPSGNSNKQTDRLTDRVSVRSIGEAYRDLGGA